jgi:Na+/H+ antiporter NhaA
VANKLDISKLRRRGEITSTGRGVADQLAALSRTEAASSGVVLGAIVAAVIWASVSESSYGGVWGTHFSFMLGNASLGMSVRDWISEGLMTFFFLVVGLEARREFDLGDLRRRGQLVIPVLAGLGAMAIPVLIFLLFNTHGPGASGWAAAMSTDTALALGLLTLVGRSVPFRLRAFIMTVFIVDDVVALIVIAFVYSSHVQILPIIISVTALVIFPVGIKWTNASAVVYVIAGVICWAGLYYGGVDPVVSGLAIGLVAPAYSPTPITLERATGAYRRFREQPTSAMARTAGVGLIGSTSPNERLTSLFAKASSFLIVPFFALANAGIAVTGDALHAAMVSPIALGIIVGYVVGKPVGTIGISLLVAKASRGRFRPPVGWGAVAGSGTIAGVGFTVAILVASIAFHGSDLENAKIGILVAAAGSAIVTWLVFQIIGWLPRRIRTQALQGDSARIVDLSSPVDETRDHIRGQANAKVTVVEYGDFECPFCGLAEGAARELGADENIRIVWRHLPLIEVHPRAQRAAQAAEAAGKQGAFWEMHDLMLSNQHALADKDLMGYAKALNLNPKRFRRDMGNQFIVDRIAEDVRGANDSGVSGTPTFFIDGIRHYGAYDVEALRAAVKDAQAIQSLNGQPNLDAPPAGQAKETAELR